MVGFMRHFSAVGVLAVLGFLFPTAAGATGCGTQKAIDIAVMGWSSAAILAHIDAVVLEKGFGCSIALIPGDTLPTFATMTTRGIPALAPELWINLREKDWRRAEATGRVADLGSTFAGGFAEGWFIPAYTAEAYPDLKTVRDLADHVALFADSSDPTQGRFYSCPNNWACDTANANLLRAYGLDTKFRLIRPRSGSVFTKPMEAALKAKKPIVFYNWGPTALMFRYDLVRLDMDAPYDPDRFACITAQTCADPQPTDFSPPQSIKAVAGWLPHAAPDVAGFLKTMTMTEKTIGDLLVWSEDNHAGPRATARHFLRTAPEIWTAWVPADVAERVMAAL